MTDTAVQAPDISEHVRGICDALDLPYDLVFALEIRRSTVRATVFLLNEQGNKHIDSSGNAARTTTQRTVRT